MEGNNRVMQANLALIADINRQRDSNRLMKNVVQAELGKIRQIIQRNNGIGGKSKKSGQGIGSMSLSVTKPPPLLDNAKSDNMATGDFRAAEAEEDLEPTELLERNRKRILALRAAISELDGKNRSNYMMMQKAFSKEMLPPLEGGASTHSNNHEELDNYQSETSDRFGKKNSFGNKEVLGISLPPVNREKNSAGGQLLLSGGSVGDNGLEYTGSNQLPVQVEASISLQMDTPFRGNGQVIGHGSTYATELPADDM